MSRPLWVDPEEQTYPALEIDLDVDIAIVGGGLSGLGAAWSLRDSGLRVALLESRTTGSGASGRNGGFVLAGSALGFKNTVAQLGVEAANDLWSFTQTNNRLIADIVDEYGLPCGYLRRGSMSLAVTDEEYASLQETHELLRENQIHTSLVAAGELPRPFDRMYAGGLYYPGNAEISSGAFVRAVAAIVANSVMIYERTPVLAIERGRDWRLETATGSINAEAVILCTNAYTARLLPRIPIQPVRGQVLATARLDRVVVPFPMYANYGYQYWRQTFDGRLVAGGWRDLDLETERGWDESHHEAIQQALLDFATQVTGETVDLEYRWSGIMGFTPDHYPFVGPLPEMQGLFIAAGYSGHGVPLAFLCGGRVAEAAGGLPLRVPSSFDPHRTVPLESPAESYNRVMREIAG